jgi:hypothetical protein
MQITANLNQKLIEAVQTSMRIEGQTLPGKTKEQAKALMEQHHVHVSICRHSLPDDLMVTRLFTVLAMTTVPNMR